MLKPTIAIVAAGLALASPRAHQIILAQTPAAPGYGTTQAAALPRGLGPLFEGITLTEAQLKQVAAIHQKHGDAIGAKSDSTNGMAAGAVDHRSLEAADLRAVLTPDQRKLFDTNLQRAKANWKKPGY